MINAHKPRLLCFIIATIQLVTQSKFFVVATDDIAGSSIQKGDVDDELLVGESEGRSRILYYSDMSSGEIGTRSSSNGDDVDGSENDHDDRNNDITQNVIVTEERKKEENESFALIASAIQKHTPQVSNKMLSIIASLIPANQTSNEAGMSSLNSEQTTFDKTKTDGDNDKGSITINNDNDNQASFIDFRDLLLPTQEAIDLGGSGNTYGTLPKTLFSMVKKELLSTNEDGELNINNVLITPMTEDFSGTPGMIHVKGDLIKESTDTMDLPGVSELPTIEFRLHDLKLQNLDILVSPISILEPTREDYSLENHLNFGPSPDGRKINITVSVTLGVTFGEDDPMNIRNEMNIGFSAESFESFVKVISRISDEGVYMFPLDSVLEPTCWLTLMPKPKLDEKGFWVESETSPEHGLAFESMIIRPATDSRLLAECTNCTGGGALAIPDVLDILHEAGVTEFLVQRLETLIEELVLSEMVQTEIDRFVYLSRLTCPHSPEYNSNTSMTGARRGYPLPHFPKFSSECLDTILFSILQASQVSAVVVAEAFAELLLDHDYHNSTLYQRKTYQPPEGANLLNYMDLGYKPADLLFESVRELLAATIRHPKRGDKILLISYMLEQALLLDDDGVLHVELPEDMSSFDVEGLMIRLNFVNVTGLTTITRFDILEPIAPQELRNNVSLANLSLVLDFSIDHLATEDPEQNITMTFAISDLDITASLIAAFDLDLLFALNVGSMLNTSYMLDCTMSTAHELHATELLVGMSSIDEIRVDGLFPESNAIFNHSHSLIMDRFGANITNVFPVVMDVLIRGMVNEALTLVRKNSVCPQNQTVPNSRFIDFNDLFSRDGVYGAIPSQTKDAIDSVLNSNDPKTNWPIINTALIAPFTENLSGEKGTIGTHGNLFALSTNLSDFGLPDFGLGEINARIFDTHIRNLHSFLPPVELMEPNATNGFLVDNRATIGGRDRPLSFTMKSAFEMTGIHNELEFNLELQEASFFAVLLMMIGTRELFTMEMGHLMKIECILSLFAVPEFDNALGLGLDHLEADLSSLDVRLSCNNCTSAGLMELPALIDKLKEAGIISILTSRIMGELGTAMMMPSSLSSGASDINGSLGEMMTEFSSVFTARCPSSGKMPTTDNDLGKQSTQTESTWDLTEESKETLLSQISPEISADTVETVVFALYPLVQIGIVVFAESLAAQNLTERDPMWGENQLAVPQSVHLVDFTATETSTTIEALNLGIDLTNDILSAPMPLPGGGTQLFLNSIIGSILDDDGVLYLDTSDFETLMGNNSNFMMNSDLTDNLSLFSDFLNVTLLHVRILGLNSFTKVELMKIIGSQTFRNVFGLRYLEVEVEILIETKNEILAYSVSFGAKDIDASISMLVALDEDKMGDLEMGSLLYTHNLLPCFLSFTHDLKVTEFDVHVSSINIFDVRGFQSFELENASEEFRALIEEHYGDTIAHSISALFNGPVVTLANEVLQQALDDDHVCPAVGADFEPDTFVDLRDLLLPPLKSLVYGGTGTSPYGDAISTAVKGLQRMFEIRPNEELSDLNYLLLGPWHDFSLLNETIAGLGLPSLSSEKPGSYGMLGTVVELTDEFPINEDITGVFTFKISNLIIENVDTIGAPLSLLELTKNEPYMLDNVASIGVGERPLRINANFILGLAAFGLEFKNEFAFSVDLHNVTVALTTITKILERRFLGFPFRDATNMDCFLATIPAPDLDARGIRLEGIEPSATLAQMLMSVAKTNLNISCISCSGPALEELEELLAKPGAQENITKDVNQVLGYVSRLMDGDIVQDQIDQMLHDASKRCPHSPQYDPMFQDVEYEPFPALKMPQHLNREVVTLLIVFCFFICMCAVCGLTVVWIVRRRGRLWLQSLPNNRLFLMKKQEDMEAEMAAALNQTTSLFRSPVIPAFVRYFIPVTIVGNIALFISGHCSFGGIIFFELIFMGESISTTMFKFSIGEAMIDMFKHGAAAIAVTALAGSMVWPYTKQLITLFFWFVPPRRISVATRGHVYEGLDELAKWSMMDVFVLIANFVGLWIKFSTPDFGYLPEDLYGFNVLMIPMWGLYANLLAQLVSQVSSHFIIHYHRETVRVAKDEFERTYRSAEAATVQSSFDERPVDVPSNDRFVDDASVSSINSLGPEDIKYSQYETIPISKPTPAELLDSFGGHPDDISGENPRIEDASLTNFGKTNETVPENLKFGHETITRATPELRDDYSDDKPYQLCKHAFIRPHRGEYDKLVIRKSINILVVLGCFLICLFVTIGSVLPSFSNETFGVIGLLISFGRQTKEAVDIYNVFDVANVLTAMSKVAGPRHIAGVGLMSALVVITIVLVPMAIAVLLVCQWFVPLTRARRKQLSFTIEILNAWQYADVFFFSLIIESWRQEIITAMAFAPLCESIQDLFPVVAHYGIVNEVNAQCLQVETRFEIGVFFLVTGIGLLHLMTAYVTRATKQYFRETDLTHRRFHLQMQNEMEQQQRCRLSRVSANDVHPPPVLFTDVYRWTLIREEDATKSSSVLCGDMAGELQENLLSKNTGKDAYVTGDGGRANDDDCYHDEIN